MSAGNLLRSVIYLHSKYICCTASNLCPKIKTNVHTMSCFLNLLTVCCPQPKASGCHKKEKKNRKISLLAWIKSA